MHTAIRWFAHNPVAANLLMTLLLLGGAAGAYLTNQEEFPSFDTWGQHRLRWKKAFACVSKKPSRAWKA